MYPKEIEDQLRTDSRQLLEEASDVNDRLVELTWGTGSHHYYATLYSYLMAAFSHIDLYSRLWDGGREKYQTKRMLMFLDHYLPKDKATHKLAIQLWRHTLMHTSRPRKLKDKNTGQIYKYLLHWGAPQLPIELHYKLEDHKFNLGLIYLLNDFDLVLENYLGEASSSTILQSNAVSSLKKIVVQSIEM